MLNFLSRRGEIIRSMGTLVIKELLNLVIVLFCIVLSARLPLQLRLDIHSGQFSSLMGVLDF